ncbi:MAG: cadherin repeat domain-containing protein, partial [Cyclobacteriaceae bacterium]
NDLDEIAPAFTSAVSVAIDENIASGIIYTAVATDASALTYSLSGTDAGSFGINSTTGDLTILSSPDFETKSSYAVTITATDALGNFVDLNLTVNVNDLDEIAPAFTSAASVAIDENIASGIIYTAVATDASALTYSISGTDAGSFLINGTTGDLTILSSPDFETKSSYAVTITATDALSNFADLNLTVNVNDLDENAPVFTSATTETIDENIASSTVIYTAAATDAGTITYSLSGTDETAFTLNASTGDLSINASPDFETQASYEVVITATDDASNTADLTLTITVTDLDENAPVFTSATSETIDENIASSTVIYTAAATDAGTITYTLSGTDETAFTLNASTGDLSINASPDFETLSSYEVVITATDDASNTADLTLTITVTDLDENAPVFTSSTSETIDENIASSTVIYTAAATDAGTITYTISGTDETAFTLNASTGELSINASPDFETQASYEVVITATDDASNTADLTLTITVTDLDENAPVFTSSTNETIDENIASSTVIYTVVATDAGTITYTLSGTDETAFTLNASTGDLSINASPDFETQASYEVVITATDDASNSTDLTLTITVTDLDENAPVFTSATSETIDENITASSVVYTAVATDVGSITYSLSGTDETAFTLNASTGDLSINASPDFETQSSYEVVITATDDASN